MVDDGDGMLFVCTSPSETSFVLEVRRIDFSFHSLEGDDDFALDIDPVESHFVGLPVADGGFGVTLFTSRTPTFTYLPSPSHPPHRAT